MGLYLFANPIVITGENKNIAFEFARTLGFEGNDPKKLLEFLRKLPALELALMNKEFRNSDQVINIIKNHLMKIKFWTPRVL